MMAPSKQSELKSRGARILAAYLYIMFFLIGFVSELGAIGANLAVMLFELIFIVFFLLRTEIEIGTHLVKLAKQRNVLFWLIVVWMFWLLVVFINSMAIYETQQLFVSALRSLEYFLHISTAYCFYHLLLLKNIKFDKLLILIPVTCLLIALNMLFAWNLYPETHVPNLWVDTPPFYMNIRQGGFHASIGFFVVLSFLYEKTILKKEQLSIFTLSAYYLLALSMLVFLFWTGGRASVLVLYLSIFLWLLSLKYLKLSITILIVLIFVLSLTALVISEYLSVMPWNGMFSAFERSAASVNIERLSSNRTALWQFAIDNIQNNGLLGLGSDSYYLAENSPTQFQPHNSILQFTMDWGLVGGVFFLSILFLVFKNGNKAYLKNVNRFSCFGFLSAIAMFSTSLLDGTLYHGQTSFYFLLALVCMFYGLEKGGDLSGVKDV